MATFIINPQSQECFDRYPVRLNDVAFKLSGDKAYVVYDDNDDPEELVE